MTIHSDESSSIVRLNKGGDKFCTTVGTLTQREPHSMLAAMFSGRHTVCKDSEGSVFLDRDGKHFRHILNWLRGGVVSNLSDSVCSELLCEAEYYQLLGLVDRMTEIVNNRRKDEEMDTDLTRADIIKYTCKPIENLRLSGVNLSGLDLSKLGAKLNNANLKGAKLTNANLKAANLRCADLSNADLKGANLHEAYGLTMN